MIQAWEAAESAIKIFKRELEELHELLPANNRIQKKIASLNRAWKKVQTSWNEMDKYLEPIKPVEIKSTMFENTQFREAWLMWKEYLNEQFNIFMASRAELNALKKIKEISEDNPKTAIYYLEHAMSRIDKHFYKVEEKENRHSKSKPSNPTIYKLPPQYKPQLTDPLEGLTN